MPPWLDSGRLRSAELDRRAALALHRGVARRPLRWICTLASRLGDGPLWLLLIAALPLIDEAVGSSRAGTLLALGGTNLAIYYLLKRSTRRARPFERCPDIRACAHVPDAFSFPSGHTLHAVAFALLLSADYPTLAPLLWSFALLVGLSRVVLGLHYPSDVVVGALIGVCTASLLMPAG